MNKIKILGLIGISVMLFSNSTSAQGTMQCKRFKAKCNYSMDDYKSNGQDLVAPLVPGEEASIALVFHNKHDYRLILCGDSYLGKLEFSIKSTKGEELFSNKNFEMTQDWDFSMTSTQRLVVTVKAPGSTAKGQAAEEGCVQLIVGNRLTPKTGFY